ncbi:MAG TPA: ParB/RepB/Spo0J family partition protein [Candidatus Moranbacteria bacterium]|nr:ParB/RepB/Spo0J family partition protein [Candidatus Moranbacteria bacterium]
MAQKGGLGRGLASLIPQKKQPTKTKKKTNQKSGKLRAPKAENEINYFGSTPYIKQEKTNIAENKTDFYPVKEGHDKQNGKEKMAVLEIDIQKIVPNEYQPRKHFDQEKLIELAESIKQHGVLQPLVVSDDDQDGFYELIAGERRLQASKLAGKKTVPVIMRTVDDLKKIEWAMIENIQRHDLNPIEEARGYKKMQDLFELTQEEIAIKTGKSRSAIANGMRLLNLPIEAQRALMDGKITEGHARSILSVTSPEKQLALLEIILKEKWTVRKTENKVREVMIGGHARKISEVNPEIQAKENELTELLGTKVKIKEKNHRGQVVIDFYSTEDLSSLISRLSN